MYVTSRSIIDPSAEPRRAWFFGTLTTYQLITIAAIGVVTVLLLSVGQKNRIGRNT